MFNFFVIVVTFFFGAEVAKIVAKFDAEKIQEIMRFHNVPEGKNMNFETFKKIMR